MPPLLSYRTLTGSYGAPIVNTFVKHAIVRVHCGSLFHQALSMPSTDMI